MTQILTVTEGIEDGAILYPDPAIHYFVKLVLMHFMAKSRKLPDKQRRINAYPGFAGLSDKAMVTGENVDILHASPKVSNMLLRTSSGLIKLMQLWWLSGHF